MRVVDQADDCHVTDRNSPASVKLRSRLRQVRAGFYALMGISGAAAWLLDVGDERSLVLAPLSIIATVLLATPSDSERRMVWALAFDAFVALALWWLFGPIVGIDFVLFYVVAISALVLERRASVRVIIAAVASELGQIPLHIVAGTRQLPLFHPEAQVVSEGEFVLGVVIRALAILVLAGLFMAVAQVISNSERARARSEARFRELYEHAPVAYVTVDNSGRIATANEAALLLFSQRQIVGVLCVELYAPGSTGNEAAERVLERVRRGERVAGQELQLAETFGPDRWISLAADPIQDPTGAIVGTRAALVDVTGQRRARVLQGQAQAQLESLVAAKDRFIASVSHEIRTPLTGVLGFAENLCSEWAQIEEPERLEMLSVIVEQSRDISFLVEDLLIAGRADVDELTVAADQIDLRHQLDQVVEQCSHVDAEFESRLSILSAVGGQDEGVWAVGDDARVRQILRNLIVNAMRHGGPNVRVVLAPSDDHVLVEVRDDGDGVPFEGLPALFEPYSSVQKVRGTTESFGLGLYVSNSLANLMGGTLFYDRDGDETVFALTLPTSEVADKVA